MTTLPNRFSLLYYLRKLNNYRRGKVPIYLRITVDAQRTELSTQMSCEPSRWNRHAGRLTGIKAVSSIERLFKRVNLSRELSKYFIKRWLTRLGRLLNFISGILPLNCFFRVSNLFFPASYL